jgi:hypothetical protein
VGVTPRGGGIELRIDELVLHGFDPRDRIAIAAAVERELASLLAAREPAGLRDGDAARLDAGSFELPHDAAPATMGAEIARAVGRGLSTPPESGR